MSAAQGCVCGGGVQIVARGANVWLAKAGSRVDCGGGAETVGEPSCPEGMLPFHKQVYYNRKEFL